MSGNYWYVIVITIKRFIHNFSMELFEGIHTELLLGGLNLIYKFSLDQSNENDETANCSIHFQLVIYLIIICKSQPEMIVLANKDIYNRCLMRCNI